jgi:uncharacterized spore protein YtfJ
MGRLTDAEAEALQKDIPPQLAELAETIGKKANATAVFGSPIVDGDRTVIPVASARFALGGGDGLIAKGVGGGMTAKPLGFIVIDRNGVRFQRTPQPSMTEAENRSVDLLAENRCRQDAASDGAFFAPVVQLHYQA